MKYYTNDKIKAKQLLFELKTVVIGYLTVGFYLSTINYFLAKFNLSKSYSDIHQYGLTWFILSFVVVALIHDTYTFWVHRLMHTHRFFKRFHLLHHKSVYVTSFSAFSFSVGEFILTFSWIPLVKITIPMQEMVTLYYAIGFILFNSFAHSGLRIYPRSWFYKAPFKWLNFDHHIHHQHLHLNMGLYFSFWDRIMGSYQAAPMPKVNEEESSNNL